MNTQYEVTLILTGMESNADKITELAEWPYGRKVLWERYQELLEANTRLHNTLQALAGLMETEAA